jgi:hypothetical protein
MMAKILSRLLALLAAIGLVGSSVPPVNTGESAKLAEPPRTSPSGPVLQACSDGWPPYRCQTTTLPPRAVVRPPSLS